MGGISPIKPQSQFWTTKTFEDDQKRKFETTMDRNQAGFSLVGLGSSVASTIIEDGIQSLGSDKAAQKMDEGMKLGLGEVIYDAFRGLQALWGLLRGKSEGYTSPNVPTKTAIPVAGADPAAQMTAVPGQPPATGTAVPGGVHILPPGPLR